jgi:membrane protease YdiL (CAAX protease family)
LKESQISWKEAFCPSPKWKQAAVLGLVAGLFFLPLAWGGQAACDWFMEKVLHIQSSPQDIVEELLRPGASVFEKVFFGFVAIGLAPVAEETLFRGILYVTIKRAGFPKLAFWGTSILFGASHVNAVSFVPLTVFGMILILLYEETDHLLAPIAAHSLFNGFNLLVLFFEEPLLRFLNLK